MNPASRWPLIAVGVCAALVLAALAWSTANVLTLESRELRARSDAAFEHSVRLALWRIDSALTPIIARESARPFDHYESAPTVEDMSGAAFERAVALNPVPELPREVPGPFVRLRFQHHQAPARAFDGASPIQTAAGESLTLLGEGQEPGSDRQELAKEQELSRPGAASSRSGRNEKPRRADVNDAVTPRNGADPRAGSTMVGQESSTLKTPAKKLASPSGETPASSDDDDFAAREQAFRRAVSPSLRTGSAPRSAPSAPEPSAKNKDPGAPSARPPGLSARSSSEGQPASETARDDEKASNESGTGGVGDQPRLEPAPSGGADVTKQKQKQEQETDRRDTKDSRSLEESRTPGRTQASPGIAPEQTRKAGRVDEPAAPPAKTDQSTGAPAENGATSAGGAPVTFKSAESERESNGKGSIGELNTAEREVVVGEFTPRWLTTSDGEPQLYFVRSVRAGAATTAQGCWLDWPMLRESLLTDVADLLPSARLVPIIETESVDAGWAPPAVSLARRLATIPARLEPGAPPQVAIPSWSPMRSALALTWVAVLAALFGLAALVRSARELADRRGRFVSAVTHELRTPLTTFVMYSQMLADGVVQGEAARAEYLSTLRRESLRLSGIVESVLDFARLGRAGGRPSVPPRRVSELLAVIVPDLSERCRQAGLRLVVRNNCDPTSHARISDTALGRVLLNLVENACKYAGPVDSGGGAADLGSDLRLTVAASRSVVSFRVSDRGPGIAPEDRRRLFKPFQRGRCPDHENKPGLGLGLSLAREIARSAGGDVRLEDSSDRGSTFTLTLPLATAEDGVHG